MQARTAQFMFVSPRIQIVWRVRFTQQKLTGIRCLVRSFSKAFLGGKKIGLIRLRTVTRQSRGSGPNLVFKAYTNSSSSQSVSVFVGETELKSINQILLATDHIARGRSDPKQQLCVCVRESCAASTEALTSNCCIHVRH